ncbi:hypothetical protein EIN_073180 [Entamoeba invadens IP1]|uniref:PiggyBac transposable element-derived protein domain-containing protein n=1 Tax=Entamoeba invadens IP1 TaxID=370355 RepID=A0A0A1UBF9_ENTIV|nr:hypothetical protein EIN_073180 [Entamoeba invadens IP1]ELP92565.1 hypothetical protein EIN_073180 [Entamoeba invadens IP1]|eukprot:XP_004259336.1 hypothetical protein EIN_073180 [Entamoeba invadens IP1]
MPRIVFQLINANIETYDVTTLPDEVEKESCFIGDEEESEDSASDKEKIPENKEETEEEDYLSCDEWVKKHPVDLTEEKLKKDVEVRQKVNDEEAIEKGVIKASNTPNSNDKFGKIREVLEAFIYNLVNNKYFTPSTTLSVDEHLCAFKGKIWAKVFIKSKPQRYSIKFWMCCDCESGMVINLQMYCGKCDNKEENQGFRVTIDMVAPQLCMGKFVIVVCDNFFCSLRLVHYLAQYGSTLLGTVRKNRVEVPEEAKQIKRYDPNDDKKATTREADTTEVYTKGVCKLLSYYNEKKKLVLIMTTMHNAKELYTVQKEVRAKDGKLVSVHKPNVIKQYNATMGGVDSADLMIHTYTCRRRTSRWNVRILYDLLDIAALNAYKVYHHHHDKVDRLNFLNELTELLMKMM